jgi:hypothetical protein
LPIACELRIRCIDSQLWLTSRRGLRLRAALAVADSSTRVRMGFSLQPRSPGAGIASGARILLLPEAFGVLARTPGPE